MEIVQRGNPSIMSKIRESAKAVSESKGLDKPLYQNATQMSRSAQSLPSNISEMFGSSNSVDSNLSSRRVSIKDDVIKSTNSTKKIDYESSMITRVLTSLDTLSDTKEYFNAIQDLLALYVSGNLDDKVLSRISLEDLSEIKSILREFKYIIDSY
jgi:hypothetical protein